MIRSRSALCQNGGTEVAAQVSNRVDQADAAGGGGFGQKEVGKDQNAGM